MMWAALLVLAQVDGGVVEDVVEVPEPVADEGPEGYTPDEASAQEVVRFTGYLDVGFAKATGNGSSFLAADTRVPLDYGNDAFAPMVNSRGDVASTETGGRFTNGFLPRSVGIGSRPSFLLNTASVDVRVQPRGVPLFMFARVQFMPRLSPTGDVTRVDLQQAFGRYSPFKQAELAFFLGRFDSVFGIEYLENEANLRLGITPSLTARYTTGQGLGAKVFYRVQLPGIWSALSLNASATTNGTRIEALVPVFGSLTGSIVGSGRLGYELNLQKLQAKLGVSGLYGPRSDVAFDPRAPSRQWAVSGDVRVNAFGFALAAELTHLEDSRAEAPGIATPKQTGLGPAELASGFVVTGGWVRLGYTLPWTTSALTATTFYARYDRREGRFVDFTQLKTARWTFGVRVDLWEFLALKAEYLTNRELAGAPLVDNDVFTSSAVFTW
jgi:hypothetical protein